MPERPERIPTVLLLAAALAAPLAWGGTPVLARAALALVLAAGLALVAVRPPAAPAALARLALLTLALPLAQLVALPDAVVGALHPRLLAEARASLAAPGEDPALAAAEADVLARAGATRTVPHARPLSVDPDATRDGTLHLALGLGALLLGAAVAAGPGGRRLLCGALAGLALFEALFGLADHFAGGALLPDLGRPWDYGLPAGTFVNPNHFAALLSLGLFAAGALVFGARGRLDDDPAPGAAAPGRARQIVLATTCAVVLLAMVWSSSRAGLAAGAAALAALALRGVLRARRMPGGSPAWILAGGALALLAAALWLRPPQPLVEDLGAMDTSWAWRFAVWRMAALEMFPAAPWTGAGVGTFPALEPLYRAAWMARPAVHAHSDWVEWLVEAGIPGALLLAGWLALGVALVRRLLRDGPAREETAWIAAGLAALACHAAVDFPLRLPGVLVPAAALAGALAGPAGRGPRRVGNGAAFGGAAWWRAAAGLTALLLVVLAGVALATLRPGLAGVESRRAAARADVETVLDRLARGAEAGEADALAARAGQAVRALRTLAVIAPLRGEIRLSQHAALRAFAAAEELAGRPVPASWRELARFYLRRAEALAPTSRARLRRVLEYWLAFGERDEAMRVARRLLVLEPGEAARVYAALEAAGDGTLGALMQATPNRPRNAVHLARHLAARGDLAGAQIVLERARTRHPDAPEVTLELAAVMFRRGRAGDALHLVDRLELPADRADLARRRDALRARLLARSGAPDALERLGAPDGEKARAGGATLDEARAEARLLIDRKRFDEAVLVLEQALERRKPPLTARERLLLLVELGRVHEAAGRFRDALAAYRRAEAIDPDDPAVRRFFERLRERN